MSSAISWKVIVRSVASIMSDSRCTIFAGVVAIICVGVSDTIAAQSILPPQPAPFLYFGSSIDADSDVAVIGAFGSEELGPLTGSAFVARRDATGQWSIEAELHAVPAFGLSQFGYSVAIDGPTAIVGSPFVGFDGFAYVFRKNASGDWLQEAALTQPDVPFPVIRFGAVVAVRGDEIFVASSVDEIEEMAVFVYSRRTDGTWGLEQALQPTGDISLGTGSSIAVHGHRLVLGNVHSAAATQDFDHLANAGAAYIFEQDASGTWHQTATLTASDAAMLDLFGSAVAIEGDTVVVGALGKQVGSTGLAGAVYTFQRMPAGHWVEVNVLIDPDSQPLAQMGHHVDLQGGRLAVRQWVDANGLNTGRVQVFRRSGAGWALQDSLAADPASQNDFFGVSATLADGQLLYHVNTADDSGRIDVADVTPALRGDLNCDGLVDSSDIAPFVSIILALGSPRAVCNPAAADVNTDGAVDGRDIESLVGLAID